MIAIIILQFYESSKIRCNVLLFNRCQNALIIRSDFSLILISLLTGTSYQHAHTNADPFLFFFSFFFQVVLFKVSLP